MNLAEFGSWALRKVSVANPAPNNKYKGQCVSLIQQFLYLVFGMPFKARGNAKDWIYNVPEGFTKLGPNVALQPGDILVYGANYGGGYGHIALIDVNGKFFDQNGIKRLAVAYRDRPFSGYACVLRPNNQAKLGLTSSVFTVRVDKAEANVRKEPNSRSALVPQPGADCLKKGDTFKAVALVDGESVNGNNKWYKSLKGNYVWSGGCTRL